MAKPQGYIVYKGPSRIDGKPIVAILTGFNKKSSNAKTGGMLQLYILVDNGKSPAENVRTGDDYRICGSCKHRGTDGRERSCYVVLIQGPRSTYQAYMNGSYENAWRTLGGGSGAPTMNCLERLRGRKVRLGAYGDPAALPVSVIDALTRACDGHTGYTHQWERFSAMRHYVMASADSPAEYLRAKRKGFRTFRVMPQGKRDFQETEIECLADSVGAHCEDCGLCDGNHRSDKIKDIAITVHGSGATHFMKGN